MNPRSAGRGVIALRDGAVTFKWKDYRLEGAIAKRR